MQEVYRYNDQGDRIEKFRFGNGITTRTDYIIDPNNQTGFTQVLEETTIDLLAQQVTGRRAYTLGHDVIAQTDLSSQATDVRFLLYDGHGSTRLLTDSNPTPVVLEHYAYDAYGNAIGFDPHTALTQLLYSGEQTDSTTGQQYLRARYYDPKSGRFSRLDPFAGDYQEPLSLHKYMYTHADPINGIDPSGNAFTIVEVVVVSRKQAELRQKDAARVQFGRRIVVRRVNDIRQSIRTRSIDAKFWSKINQFRSFRSSNFRHNLRILTGRTPSNSNAHHAFSKEFRRFFSSKGINVNDPRFGQWWRTPNHQALAARYNQIWRRWISINPNATTKQVLVQGRTIMKQFGFTPLF